jgi:hypothetical protein
LRGSETIKIASFKEVCLGKGLAIGNRIRFGFGLLDHESVFSGKVISSVARSAAYS